MAALVRTIDVRVVEQVIATGATMSEIAQAVAEIEDELGFDEHRGSCTPRVAQVRALLEPLFEKRSNIWRGRD